MASGSAASSGHAHAREAPAREERVAALAEEMRELRWERGKSSRKFAELWGLAVGTVENDAAEASRRVRSEVQDPEETARDISVGLRKLFLAAVHDDDRKNAHRLADTWATVSGAKAPEKHQIGALDAVTPGKAREVMGELFGSVTPGETPDAGSER